jgi:hypothetical protein
MRSVPPFSPVSAIWAAATDQRMPERVTTCAMPDNHVVFDLDTPGTTRHCRICCREGERLAV